MPADLKAAIAFNAHLDMCYRCRTAYPMDFCPVGAEELKRQAMEDTARLSIALAALERIASPIRALQGDADEQGLKLDGQAAIELARNPTYLSSTARTALNRIAASPAAPVAPTGIAADPDATETEPGTLFETVRLGLCLGASGKERDDAIRALYSIAGRSFEDATPRALKAVGLCSRCGHGRSTCGVGLGEYTGEVQPAASPSIAATPDAPSDPTPAPLSDTAGRLLKIAEEIDLNEPFPGWRSDRDFLRALAITHAPNTPTPDTQ